MSAGKNAQSGVLSGIRVLDFTWKTVGPWAPRLLTHYGAEVIHVERADGWDSHRYNAVPSIVSDDPQPVDLPSEKKVHSDPQFNTLSEESTDELGTEQQKLYAAPYFNTLHHGKLAISLNTKSEEGLKIIEQLIGVCDAVVENFSAEVLPSWGLTWERMHTLNPRLVYMSTSGFGHTGDWKGYRSFGPTAAAQSGLSLASGLPGEPPAGWGFSYLDVMGGWMGGLALVQGLLQAKKTGEGAYIDYSVTEGAMSMLGTYMLDYQVNGRRTRRPDFPPGNRSVFPSLAPHNTYRCAGKDRVGQDWWVFIACETQPQFEALCGVMEQPALALDPKFANNETRVTNQDELDTIIGRWTRPRRRYNIMRQCQAVGVIAAPVQSAEDRVEYDPQLQHRQMHPIIDHPELGAVPYEGYPVKMSRTPAFVHGRAPTYGEHNNYVYGELLGMSDDEIHSLHERGII
ncbi:MAG: crotonobetainyl-CoA:carnitine CoA-transferase CaiB-like acyl-CoA transferase [Alphaproteobacteria bacterium]|jgi:crotonobetainyl-CoA:carnitine CoA-transferase CaiB-like acyl-CoA transferase